MPEIWQYDIKLPNFNNPHFTLLWLHPVFSFRVISGNNRNKKDLSAYDYAKGSEFDIT